MPCFHKFFGHYEHMPAGNGLLPNWDADTLIIGTFNPENEWTPDNDANYFYGRPRNLLWELLPRFANNAAIHRQDIDNQYDFLQSNHIALTDLLISIDDANIENLQHLNWIRNYKDTNINNFHEFTWNTEQIVNFIHFKNIQAVYFTKLGGEAPFGEQMTFIETFCDANNILHFRLNSPSGQGLGRGRPKINKLTDRWFNQGGNQFPFLGLDFNQNDFPWN